MKLARDLTWANVRPIGADEQQCVLRTFFAIDQCFQTPAWVNFPDEAPREPVTIMCGRCGQPHTYRSTATRGKRKFCDDCVRT